MGMKKSEAVQRYLIALTPIQALIAGQVVDALEGRLACRISALGLENWHMSFGTGGVGGQRVGRSSETSVTVEEPYGD